MTRAEQLEKIKSSLNITGNALDNTLGIYLDDVKYYMADAGVNATVLDSEASIGCICRGVADLYINNEFSAYFYQRVSQLAIQVDIPEPEPEPTEDWVEYCGVTPTLTLGTFDPEMGYTRKIYKKADELKINYEAIVVPSRAVSSNTQLQVAKVDDNTAYPANNVFFSGIVFVGSKAYTATFKLWDYGSISVTCEAELPAGEDVHMAFSGQYPYKG